MNRKLPKGTNASSHKSTALAGCMLLALVSMIMPRAAGQATAAAEPAPAAEKAFIADAGGDFGHYAFDAHRANAGGDFGYYAFDADRSTDRAYGVFFADMKKWGRYEIVPSPAHADWMFQINVGNSSRCVDVTVQDADPDPNSKRPIPQTHRTTSVINDDWVEVVMMDIKTMETRRRFVEHLRASNPFSSYEATFDRAIATLIDDLKGQLGEAPKTHVEHLETPAPLPPQITSAQTIFLSDISENDAEADKLSGGGARLYQEMSRALRSWGRYELVDKATHSDLILEVSFQVYRRCDWHRDHRFRVFLRDPRTGVLLWGLTTHAESPVLPRNERNAFDAGVAELVNEVRAVAETPTWAADASIPARPPAIALQAVSGSSTGAVSATLSAQKSVVKSGAEQKVEVAVKNSLKQDLKFVYPEGDPLTCVIAVRDADGKMAPVTEQGRRLQEAHATQRGRPMAYSLHPGETQRRECAVSELYDLSHTGKYFIQVQQLDGRSAQSNTLVLTVVP